jgi:uncharacterized membrane protein
MNKKEIFLTGLIVLMFIIAVYFYQKLPDKIPTHWNAEGKINGYSSKAFGIFLLPSITVIMYLLFLLIPKIEVYKKNIQAFSKHFFIFKLALILFFMVLFIVTIMQSMGYIFNMNYVIIPACAILFYIIGYMLKYAKRNFFIGIRTPWTLSSEKVWDKTHALGSTLFKIVSLTALMGMFFGKYGFWIMLIPLLTISLFLVVYSYVLFSKEKAN